jgi:signal transduction histidine kinase
MLVDGVLAAALVFGGLGPAFAKGMFLGIPLSLGLAVPVVFRRKHPVVAYYTAVAAGGLQVALEARPSVTDVAILILLYTLAAYTPRRTSVWGLAVCLAGSAVGVLRWISLINHSLLEWLTAGAMLFAGPALLVWVVGDSMRYRRAYYASLEDRAARLEAERDAQAQIAAAAERARIARELHDVIAHNVSVMVVQADGASYALDADPARAREALAAISATGRQALAEMRRLLGVLRREADSASSVRAPQPGIGELGELLDQARGAGLPVSFTVEGDPQPLPGGVALAAYRIVQESLTNTRKHAGPVTSAAVLLRYSPDTVVLTISDDGWGDLGGTVLPGAPGHGMTGMRERVAIYGGSVTAGPRPGGGFEVVATLPLSLAQVGAA